MGNRTNGIVVRGMENFKNEKSCIIEWLLKTITWIKQGIINIPIR